MKDVYTFLEENTVQYLATIDENGFPKVRPFMMLAIDNGKFYFAVGSDKDVCKELKNNPNLELAASSPTFEWLRISGKAAFVDDADLKRKLTKESEISESVYKNSKDSDFEIFYIAEPTVLISLSGSKEPKVLKPY